MDSATAVNTDAAASLLGFTAIVFLLLFLIARWKWHVFFALLIPILLFGILPGIQQNNFIDAFENGFGNTLGSIGVVIVLGSIIAEALKHTGAIQVITRSMVPESNSHCWVHHLVLGLSGRLDTFSGHAPLLHSPLLARYP